MCQFKLIFECLLPQYLKNLNSKKTDDNDDYKKNDSLNKSEQLNVSKDSTLYNSSSFKKKNCYSDLYNNIPYKQNTRNSNDINFDTVAIGTAMMCRDSSQ